MMGLLGNVAECENLRLRLMKPDYIERFSSLLGSESDGIEVSYNAAGILSHIGTASCSHFPNILLTESLILIVSDGEQVWNQHLSAVDRANVLARMRNAISRWQINSKRNINYR